MGLAHCLFFITSAAPPVPAWRVPGIWLAGDEQCWTHGVVRLAYYSLLGKSMCQGGLLCYGVVPHGTNPTHVQTLAANSVLVYYIYVGLQAACTVSDKVLLVERLCVH